MGRQTDKLVRLIARQRGQGKTDHYARYRDPDTRKVVDVNLARLGITTARGRRQFVREKGEALGRRLLEIELGITTRRSETAVQEARDRFLERVARTLRPATHRGYSTATKKFLAWSLEVGLEHCEDIGKAELSEFYDWLLATGRAATGINSNLSAVKSMLSDWHRRGLLPATLSLADAHSTLPLIRVDRGRPAILDQKGIRELLRACQKSDRTGRYTKAGPVILTFLLSGVRLGELLGLTWDNVHLCGADPRLVVTASSTKKRCERDVDLSVTPALVRILAALGEQKGAGRVFPVSKRCLDDMRGRLTREFGAPKFTFSKTHFGTPTLRATAASFLTSAPGIYKGASVFHAASRHGHRVEVAQAHYLNRVRVPSDATSLEAAMGIEDEIEPLLGTSQRI